GPPPAASPARPRPARARTPPAPPLAPSPCARPPPPPRDSAPASAPAPPDRPESPARSAPSPSPSPFALGLKLGADVFHREDKGRLVLFVRHPTQRQAGGARSLFELGHLRDLLG